MSRHVICRVEELPPGESRLVTINGRTVGIFNVGGSYHALLNRCPHLAAPLCKGVVTGLITSPAPYKAEFSRDGEILRCPWHGWEFDILTGQSVYNPHRVRVRTYQVLIEPDAREETGGEAADDAADSACPAFATIGPDDPDPSIETFPISVEQQHVVLYMGESRPAQAPAATARPTTGEA
jgi:3-phenylpropionate/trans-cinnamate dioxygenase ferredoxin subunit